VMASSHDRLPVCFDKSAEMAEHIVVPIDYNILPHPSGGRSYYFSLRNACVFHKRCGKSTLLCPDTTEKFCFLLSL